MPLILFSSKEAPSSDGTITLKADIINAGHIPRFTTWRMKRVSMASIGFLAPFATPNEVRVRPTFLDDQSHMKEGRVDHTLSTEDLTRSNVEFSFPTSYSTYYEPAFAAPLVYAHASLDVNLLIGRVDIQHNIVSIEVDVLANGVHKETSVGFVQVIFEYTE